MDHKDLETAILLQHTVLTQMFLIDMNIQFSWVHGIRKTYLNFK